MGDFVEFAPPLVEVPHVAIVVVLDVADMPALLAVFQVCGHYHCSNHSASCATDLTHAHSSLWNSLPPSAP